MEKENRLTYYAPSPRKYSAFYKCNCEKGTIKEITISAVKTGSTRSCGCLSDEHRRTVNITHNMSKTDEYKIWRSIKKRCYLTTHKHYDSYGGRGIKMCDRWLESFENFYEDMGDRPSKKHSIDRINNNDNYYKENCKWATTIEQRNNTRTNRYITYKNITKTLSEWSRELNIPYEVLRQRLKRNSIEKAFTMQYSPYKKSIENKTTV